jgi:hypothetical protein
LRRCQLCIDRAACALDARLARSKVHVCIAICDVASRDLLLKEDLGRLKVLGCKL